MKGKIKNWPNIIFIVFVLFIAGATLSLILDFTGRIHLPSILKNSFLFAIFAAIAYPLKRFFGWLIK